MAQSLRVLLMNMDGSCSAELRSQLLQHDGLKIVAELDDASLLPQAVAQFPVDLVFLHLDPSPDFVLEIGRQVIEGHPGLAVFAMSECTDGELILTAMRAGIREFFPKPLKDEDLARALGKIQTTGGVVSREQGKLIAVMGASGGAGASTIAANLAVELSALVGKPRRVALVDMDFRFGQIATMLDIQPQFTVADLCETQEQIDPQMIDKALADHDSGVRVLARPNSFVQADTITAAHCVSVLSALAEACDYVVVDGPTRYDIGALSVIDSADVNLLVMQLLVTSVRNTDRICQELSQHGFNFDRLRLVCNRVDHDPGFLQVSQVEKTLGRSIFATIPDDWKSVSASVNIGQPLTMQWGRTKVRQAIKALAERLHTGERDAEEKGAKSGLFGRLFGSGKKPAAPEPAATPRGVAPAPA